MSKNYTATLSFATGLCFGLWVGHYHVSKGPHYLMNYAWSLVTNMQNVQNNLVVWSHVSGYHLPGNQGSI